MRPPRHPLIAIHAIVFLDVLGFGIILPLLPHYAVSLGAAGFGVGALATAYSLAQLVAAPVLGRLSDRVGRRPVLLASLAGSALSLALTAVAGSLELLLLGRALAGAFGGSIATAQAYVADVTAPEVRARHMGTLGAAIGLGFVVGPPLGAALSPFGIGTAAFTAAGLAVATLIYALWALPESRWNRTPAIALSTPCNVSRSIPRQLPDRRTYAELPTGCVVPQAPQDALLPGQPATDIPPLPSPAHVRPLLAATFLVTSAFVTLEVTLALLAHQRFQLGPAGLGALFGFLGLVIVASRGALGPLSGRYGERLLAGGGALALGAALLALAAAPTLSAAVLALAFAAAGQGLAAPALATLVSRARGPEQQGSILGASQSMAAAARAAGPIGAGWLYDVNATLPYLAACALATLAAWEIMTSRDGPPPSHSARHWLTHLLARWRRPSGSTVPPPAHRARARRPLLPPLLKPALLAFPPAVGPPGGQVSRR